MRPSKPQVQKEKYISHLISQNEQRTSKRRISISRINISGGSQVWRVKSERPTVNSTRQPETFLTSKKLSLIRKLAIIRNNLNSNSIKCTFARENLKTNHHRIEVTKHKLYSIVGIWSTAYVLNRNRIGVYRNETT